MSGRHERAQWVRLDIDGIALLADLAGGVSLARPLLFGPGGLRFFGAAAAVSTPLRVPGFNGRVAKGASCNCSVLMLTPHANGTHTECAAHLTVEPLDAYRVIPQRLLPTLLLTLPAPQAGPIDAATLEQAWLPPLRPGLSARALVIRTLPNHPRKFGPADEQGTTPPFLSPAAADAIVNRGIEHLVVDLPSIDRLDDPALSAHRCFFGLPPGVTQLGEATRRGSTLTELAYVDDALLDGWYLLLIQAPAIAGDAVPSQPLLYPLRPG